jgi:general L-amino acid transport system substrate-binding protein
MVRTVVHYEGSGSRWGFKARGRLVIGLAVLMSACSSAGGNSESAHAIGRLDPVSNTPTVDGVRRKGFVQCGVTTGVAGFSAPDAQGQWRGLDVDVCRAIAAAVLGDAAKVRYTPLTAAQRFTALQSGEIDILSRVTTITFQRDVQLGIEFPAINWYDGTGFIVRRAINVKSVKDLNGATICIQPGTSTALDVADYFRKHRLKFTPVVIERFEEAINAYFAGRCDAFSQDQSALAAVRARAPQPADHELLPEVISKSPFGPGVMPNDLRWMEIVRWSVYAMVDAEELGLTSATIEAAVNSDDPALERFVGKSGGFGEMLGLDAGWALRIVQQVGSYAESFDRNLRPLGIERGHNRLWKDGGLLYTPDLR